MARPFLRTFFKFGASFWIAGLLALIAGLSVTSLATAGTTTYKYDAQNQLIEVDYANGSKVLYTYDAAGNCTQVVKTT